MAQGQNLVVVTDDTFADLVEQASGLFMVDFWATWCGPCRMVAPIVEEIADEFGERGLTVGKLDVDHNPSTAARFGVRSIPSILFFLDGKHVDTVVGAVPKPTLVERVESHLD